MNKSVLIIRPNHDNTTNYLYCWATLIIQEAEKKDFNIVDLKGIRANIRELKGIVKKIKPALVFFNGHGDSNTITGYDNQVLIQTGKNEDLLLGKIVYALTCRSAEKLGSKCVKTGTKAYIGYNDDFIFLFEEDKISRPLQDKTAGLFLGPSNQPMMSLLKGNTAGESHQRSQKAFKKNIWSILSSLVRNISQSVLEFTSRLTQFHNYSSSDYRCHIGRIEKLK